MTSACVRVKVNLKSHNNNECIHCLYWVWGSIFDLEEHFSVISVRLNPPDLVSAGFNIPLLSRFCDRSSDQGYPGGFKSLIALNFQKDAL